MDQQIERRKDQEGKERGGDDSANHDSCKRALHFRACADVKGHGYKSERRDQGGHQHAAASGNALTWTVGTLANGANLECSVTVEVTAIGPIANTATVASATMSSR